MLLTGEDPARDERHLLAFIAYEGWLMGNKPSAVAGKLSEIQWHHPVPETTCDFYPNNPNNPEKTGIIRQKTAESSG